MICMLSPVDWQANALAVAYNNLAVSWRDKDGHTTKTTLHMLLCAQCRQNIGLATSQVDYDAGVKSDRCLLVGFRWLKCPTCREASQLTMANAGPHHQCRSPTMGQLISKVQREYLGYDDCLALYEPLDTASGLFLLLLWLRAWQCGKVQANHHGSCDAI